MRVNRGLVGVERPNAQSLPLKTSSLDRTLGTFRNRKPFCSFSGSRVRSGAMSETACAFFHIADFRQV